MVLFGQKVQPLALGLLSPALALAGSMLDAGGAGAVHAL